MLFIAENECRLLPKETGKDQAVEYYRSRVVGKVRNSRGDVVRIDLREVNHLFVGKDHRGGELLLPRVRRLPWIVPALRGTAIIRLQTKDGKTRERYLCEVGVLRRINGTTVTSPEFFCVIVDRSWDAKKRRTHRKFITAYPMKESKFRAACAGDVNAYSN